MTTAPPVRAVAPLRATTIATVKPRAFLHCIRWHRHWHTTVSATATDCDRCGLRWSW